MGKWPNLIIEDVHDDVFDVLEAVGHHLGILVELGIVPVRRFLVLQQKFELYRGERG